MVKRPKRKPAKRGPKEERLAIPPDKLADTITNLLTRPKPKKT